MIDGALGSGRRAPRLVAAAARACGVAIPLVLAVTAAAGPPDGDESPPVGADDRPAMRSLESRTALDAIPSTAALSRARVEYRRRHGGSGDRAGSSAAAARKAEELMNDAAAERSRALRWVLLDEARKTGIASGNAVVVSRAVRLLSAEFAVDGAGLEYRSLREIPLQALRGQRASEVARAAEALSTRADLDGRPGLAIDALALAVRAWQAAGADAAARAVAERHDRLLAEAREDAAASRGRDDAGRRPADRDRPGAVIDPDDGGPGSRSR